MALSFENPKEYITELIGTLILVLIGCLAAGSTVNAWGFSGMATGAAFALTFVGLIYCVGKYSNCHFNPLISLSMFISGKMKANDTLFYVLAQLIGGIIGAIIAFFTLSIGYDTWDVFIFPSTYGGYFARIEFVGAIIVEFFLAFILAFIAMKATESKKIDIKSGAIIAVAMFGLMWMFSDLTFSAINPAKSLGAAIAMLFSGIENHVEPLVQIWFFIIFPALGAIVGTFIYMVTESDEFDLNKYLSAIKKKKEEKAADEEYAEESEENAEEPAAEEEPAEEVVEDTEEEIPEIESVEEDALPEVESAEEAAEETVVESEEPVAETKTE